MTTQQLKSRQLKRSGCLASKTKPQSSGSTSKLSGQDNGCRLADECHQATDEVPYKYGNFHRDGHLASQPKLPLCAGALDGWEVLTFIDGCGKKCRHSLLAHRPAIERVTCLDTILGPVSFASASSSTLGFLTLTMVRALVSMCPDRTHQCDSRVLLSNQMSVACRQCRGPLMTRMLSYSCSAYLKTCWWVQAAHACALRP